MTSLYNPLHLLPLPPTPTDPKPLPTALTIDPFADLLWIGTSSGHTSALCSPLHLTPNVRYPAHGSHTNVFLTGGMGRGVKAIRVTDREVWTLTEGGIGGRKRGGAVKWSVSDPTRGLRSMSPNPTNSHEVLGGGVNGLMVANTTSGDIVRRVDTSSPIVHLVPIERNVFSASLSGHLAILDPRTGFKTSARIQTAQAHTGGLNGADCVGNIVCTWGWTHRAGHPLADTHVRLYDVRTLRPLAPIPFPAGPAFCVLHPTDATKMIIASAQGAVQLADLSAGTASAFQQLDVNSFVTSMALSPAGDYLAFGDADGHVHLWTTHDMEQAARGEDGNVRLPSFNGYDGIKPEWPDRSEAPASVNWEDNTPLNIVGMPYYTEPLLSNFPPADYAPVTSPFFNPPEPIPNSVLNTMKMVDFVGYATTPQELRGKRYVVTARPGAGKRATGKAYGSRRDSAPRFRSEKDRKAHRQSISGELDEEVGPGEVPKYYRKVEIKYSKFGIEDFDFAFYNRTQYSGLETDILNSYTNSLLQALHYTSPIRTVAKGHICVNCKKEHCLLCEAGFLFRMLEDAKGINCQASNFSRAFSATPQASALGLLVENEKALPQYGSLIQNFNRWLLSTISTEAIVEGQRTDIRPKDLANMSLESAPIPSAIDQVLGIDLKTTNTCQACGHIATRFSTLQAVDLAYPRKIAESPSFAELLRSSIIRETSTRAACSHCKQFAPLLSQRVLARPSDKGLPPVICVNAMVSGPEVFEVWKDKQKGKQTTRYLPGRVAFRPTEEGDMKVDEEGVAYEVKSIVVQIQETPETSAHLLSFVKMSAEGENSAHWVMFNDFLVRRVSEEDVFGFPDSWKVPAIIILERVDSCDVLNFDAIPTKLDTEVLFKDVSVARNRRKHLIKHQILQKDELPQPGTLIAIDAEFVALQQEEMEFRSDGTKNIVRPSHMSLARVSVLRGQGAKERTPFIDDYIHTSEAVVDYLTEYSGIKNGDLDTNNSPHTLVPLKVAYKKLRLLVDLGCIFVGHGLSKDFRTINIFVPPEQVMDTVNIYSVPGQRRKLSLRFLSWFLLKKDIQTTTHDSIEDARYALLLYKLYQEFEAEGRFEDVMEDIFVEGQKLGFKPPQDRSASPAVPPQKQNKRQQGLRTDSNGQLVQPPPQPDWGRSPVQRDTPASIPHPRRR